LSGHYALSHREMIRYGMASRDVRFTITDGTIDFAVGEGFDLTIAVGSGKYAPLALVAVDGTQTAAGISGESMLPARISQRSRLCGTRRLRRTA
jgi:hypothetical protein